MALYDKNDWTLEMLLAQGYQLPPTVIYQYNEGVNKKALTPQFYATLVAAACKNKAPKVDVVDIRAVPDY